MIMTIDKFWELIDKINQDALNEYDEEGAVEPLINILSELHETEIEEFYENLSKVLFAIDGKNYTDNAGDSGESDDGFLYCRCYVVAKGKEYYEKVLGNPTEMPKNIDQWFESLLYVAEEAWSNVTGKVVEKFWDFIPSVSFETGSNTKNW